MYDLEYLHRLEDEYADIESQRLELDAKEDVLKKAISGLKELSALENRPIVKLIPRHAVADALAALRAEMAAVANGSTTALMPGTVELVAKSSASYWMTRVGATIAALGLDAAQEKSV